MAVPIQNAHPHTAQKSGGRNQPLQFHPPDSRQSQERLGLGCNGLGVGLQRLFGPALGVLTQQPKRQRSDQNHSQKRQRGVGEDESPADGVEHLAIRE